MTKVQTQINPLPRKLLWAADPWILWSMCCCCCCFTDNSISERDRALLFSANLIHKFCELGTNGACNRNSFDFLASPPLLKPLAQVVQKSCYFFLLLFFLQFSGLSVFPQNLIWCFIAWGLFLAYIHWQTGWIHCSGEADSSTRSGPPRKDESKPTQLQVRSVKVARMSGKRHDA